MESFKLNKRRRRLLKFVKAGTFEQIVTKDLIVTGLVIPIREKDAIARLIESNYRGIVYVIWNDYQAGQVVYRPLESQISPSYLISHPHMGVRIHIIDCCGEEQGFIEPDLFIGFIPDWEEML